MGKRIILVMAARLPYLLSSTILIYTDACGTLQNHANSSLQLLLRAVSCPITSITYTGGGSTVSQRSPFHPSGCCCPIQQVIESIHLKQTTPSKLPSPHRYADCFLKILSRYHTFHLLNRPTQSTA